MPLSDVDYILMNLPKGVVLTRNGMSAATNADVIAGVLSLPEVGGNKHLALAELYRNALATGGFMSETLGEYSYSLCSQSEIEGRIRYWEQLSRRGAVFRAPAPTVQPRMPGPIYPGQPNSVRG